MQGESQHNMHRTCCQSLLVYRKMFGTDFRAKVFFSEKESKKH